MGLLLTLSNCHAAFGRSLHNLTCHLCQLQTLNEYCEGAGFIYKQGEGEC